MYNKEHFPAHQQALIINNIVTEVLAFSEHNKSNIKRILKDKQFDTVVDLCNVMQDAYIGSAWDGSNFKHKPFDSWFLDGSLEWHPPVPKPKNEISIWDENNLKWIIIDPDCGCPKES